MEHRPRIKRLKITQRSGKVKAKSKGQKSRSSAHYLSAEEKHIPTKEEVTDRTFKRLRNLGYQRFGSPPFNYHFNRWLMNLKNVLSEFESSPSIDIDDQFSNECSQILSSIEQGLEEIRCRETSINKDAIKNLSDAKIILKQIEEEYTAKRKENEVLRNNEIKRLSSKVDDLKEELNRISHTKISILGLIIKKKTQKMSEITQRLNTTQEEIALAIKHFSDEQQMLKDEYNRKKQPIIERIQNLQKDIESQEIDNSLEKRQAACEEISKTVNALLLRSK